MPMPGPCGSAPVCKTARKTGEPSLRLGTWMIGQLYLKTVDIGEGIHFVQEDNPHKIGEELAEWHQGL